MMEDLIKVQDTFLIAGRGLVLLPDLPVPTGAGFTSFRCTVQLEAPTGRVAEEDAVMQLEHLHLVGGGSRWHVVVTLPNATKDQVPVGSIVRASAETVRTLRGRG